MTAIPARHLVLIAALALAVRLPYVLLYPQVGASCEDCRFYDEVGGNVADGNGFIGGFASETFAGPVGHPVPEAGMGPIYPLVIASVYRTVGRSALAIGVLQSVMGAGAAVLAALIGAWFSRRTGVIAGVLTAVCPALVAYSGVMLTESSSALMLALCVYLVGIARRKPAWAPAALAGIALGATTLLRPECVLLLPLAAIAVFWPPSAARATAGVVLGLAACLTIAPWTIRNYRVFGRPILVTAVGGNALWISTTGWDEWPANDPELQSIVAGLDYVGQNEALGRAAVERIKKDPLQYARYSLRRIPVFWISSHTTYVRGLSDRYASYIERGQHARLFVKALFLAFSLLSLALAAAGLVAAWRGAPRWDTLLVAGPIITIFVVHVFLYASPRYQVPLLPLLLVFAAVALDGRQSATIKAPV